MRDSRSLISMISIEICSEAIKGAASLSSLIAVYDLLNSDVRPRTNGHAMLLSLMCALVAALYLCADGAVLCLWRPTGSLPLQQLLRPCSVVCPRAHYCEWAEADREHEAPSLAARDIEPVVLLSGRSSDGLAPCLLIVIVVCQTARVSLQ